MEEILKKIMCTILVQKYMEGDATRMEMFIELGALVY
jgi:hypothetical protein